MCRWCLCSICWRRVWIVDWFRLYDRIRVVVYGLCWIWYGCNVLFWFCELYRIRYRCCWFETVMRFNRYWFRLGFWEIFYGCFCAGFFCNGVFEMQVFWLMVFSMNFWPLCSLFCVCFAGIYSNRIWSLGSVGEEPKTSNLGRRRSMYCYGLIRLRTTCLFRIGMEKWNILDMR